jgi:hypothetical protein
VLDEDAAELEFCAAGELLGSVLDEDAAELELCAAGELLPPLPSSSPPEQEKVDVMANIMLAASAIL